MKEQLKEEQKVERTTVARRLSSLTDTYVASDPSAVRTTVSEPIAGKSSKVSFHSSQL